MEKVLEKGIHKEFNLKIADDIFESESNELLDTIDFIYTMMESELEKLGYTLRKSRSQNTLFSGCSYAVLEFKNDYEYIDHGRIEFDRFLKL